QGERRGVAGPAQGLRRHRLLPDRERHFRYARAGGGGTPDRRAPQAGDPAASRGRARTGTLGARGLRGFRGARVPSGAAQLLPARAAVGRCRRGGLAPGGLRRMSVVRTVRLLTLASALAAAAASATAQAYYGTNQVEYHKFNWLVIETEHFTIHYYPEEATVAMDVARMAERDYTRLSRVFQWE